MRSVVAADWVTSPSGSCAVVRQPPVAFTCAGGGSSYLPARARPSRLQGVMAWAVASRRSGQGAAVARGRARFAGCGVRRAPCDQLVLR